MHPRQDDSEPLAIDLQAVTKRFMTPSGTTYTALKDLSLQVAPGEFCAVVGPTGCGKSTTLTLVVRAASRPGGNRRSSRCTRSTASPAGVGYMFQSDAVLPWKAVLDNVALGLASAAPARPRPRRRPATGSRRVGLAGFEDRYPHQLSGGMRKRVALAADAGQRAREILLMDEPFGALDVQTRAIMQNELLELWAGPGAAVVFVTHDLEEAIALADKVVVMTAGPGARSRRVSRSTCRARARGAGDPLRRGVSSICTTRSGMRCARKWMSPTPKPPQ